jgi:hypothetical protein
MLTQEGLWKNFENPKSKFAKAKYCVAFPQETRLEFPGYFGLFTAGRGRTDIRGTRT